MSITPLGSYIAINLRDSSGTLVVKAASTFFKSLSIVDCSRTSISSNEGPLSWSDQELGVRNPIARSISAFFKAPFDLGSRGSFLRLPFVGICASIKKVSRC